MKKKKPGLLKRLRKGQRGQSMVAYSVVTAAILGGLATMSIYVLPRMIEAFNRFTESLYFGINMPFP